MSIEGAPLLGNRLNDLRVLVVAAGFGLLSSPVHSATLDEAALRLAVAIARDVLCPAHGAEDYNISVLPFEDATQSLSDGALDQLQTDFLTKLLQERPSCVEVTEVGAAFETLTYFQNLGRWEDLAAGQRQELQARLAGADAVVFSTISRVDGLYRATVELTDLPEGTAVASASFDVPEQYTTNTCGSSAVSERRGLEALSTALYERLGPSATLYVEPATYQNTGEALGYGHYIADQFISFLSETAQNILTGEGLSVRAAAEGSQTTVGDNEFSTQIRYWPCDDLSAARVNVSATSRSGAMISLTQELSLSAVPSGVAIMPYPTAGSLESEDTVDHGVMRVAPRLVRAGDILTIYAEPPSGCSPFFFDVSTGGQLTPIPLDIFDITEIRPGLIRYENNSESDYGIIVQPEDELGTHRLGFICEPADLTRDGIRNVFRQLRTEFAETNQGVLMADDLEIIFNTMTYEILR